MLTTRAAVVEAAGARLSVDPVEGDGDLDRVRDVAFGQAVPEAGGVAVAG
jgi:hypothetical protein